MLCCLFHSSPTCAVSSIRKCNMHACKSRQRQDSIRRDPQNTKFYSRSLDREFHKIGCSVQCFSRSKRICAPSVRRIGACLLTTQKHPECVHVHMMVMILVATSQVMCVRTKRCLSCLVLIHEQHTERLLEQRSRPSTRLPAAAVHTHACPELPSLRTLRAVGCRTAPHTLPCSCPQSSPPTREEEGNGGWCLAMSKAPLHAMARRPANRAMLLRAS